jgi:large subunit ribosomal protein L25
MHPGNPEHQLCSLRHIKKIIACPPSAPAFLLGWRYHRLPPMAANATTSLKVAPREAGGSRQARRLRREGNVLGVVYGGGGEPLSFQVQARELRHALADAGAVMDLTVEGGVSGPVVVKDLVRHPVSGATVHIDLLRVRLDQKIQATVGLELTGAEESPGAIEGGVLEQITRELTIEALPNDIPDLLTHDVSTLQIGDTVTLEAISPPGTVTLIDDPEMVIATLTPPRLQTEGDDEIEQETELVGDGGAQASGGADSDDAGGSGSDDSGE